LQAPQDRRAGDPLQAWPQGAVRQGSQVNALDLGRQASETVGLIAAPADPQQKDDQENDREREGATAGVRMAGQHIGCS
jgi:hypothetical protein